MTKKINNKNKFDYIILGGGCAGLSLAYHLSISQKLKQKSLCIIEKRDLYERDKTWSFWNLGNNIFEDCAIKTWNSFKISTSKKSTVVDCKKFPYVSIDSNLFYKKILKHLKSNKNITFFKSKSDVNLNQGIIFNSLPKPMPKGSNEYYQHFYGIEIQTDRAYFDPNQLHLMDFAEAEEGVHFFYTLPFSENKALIETTWISKKNKCTKKDYLNQVRNYVKDKLKIDDYDIKFSEQGCLPLYHSSIKTGKNEILIGSSANLIRKSTGYAFLNIQNHSKFITKNLDSILSISKFKLKSKYNFYDEILFRVIERNPRQMPEIFISMFSKNTDSVIKFLSSNSSLVDDFNAIMNLPKKYFLKALIR